jgi:uncharacterized protein (DUF1800 family)
MDPTRRSLLLAAGGGCLLSALGCSPGEALSALVADPHEPVCAPPDQAGIDLVGHVLNRCTFGARPGDRAAILALGATPEAAVDAWLARQLDVAALDDADCERLVRRFDSLGEPVGELYEYRPRVLLRELTSATVLRAARSQRQLHEVMVEFWSDHFSIDISKGECAWLKVADDREVVRRHALGSFPAMLRASALSPAMLWYLDGRVNRAEHPGQRANENYARELMELHTLGVHGGYTQRDVMEAARCLTGWTVRDKQGFFKARVEFHAQAHDDGEKQVLGRLIPAGLGGKDLDLLLDIVALHPATARFVAGKLCQRFIADAPPAAAVDAVAQTFTATAGDIRSTLRALFRTREFRADAAIRGGRLKRPFHYLVSCLRALDAETDARPALTDYLGRMGHAPFQHPTPDGYALASDAWTGTLMWRWQLANALVRNRLGGTRIDISSLRRRLGGDGGLAAHLLGRLPDDEERALLGSTDAADDLALMLASPAFQRC